MTCIVGIIEGGRVHLGADSCGSTRWTKMIRIDRKIFARGEFVFGFTSSFRMGQLLQFSFQPPPIPAEMDLFEYMVTAFVESVRACLKAGGYTKISDSVETGGTFFVGVRGRLFRIEDDFQVAESADGYDACGCGEAYALGSLYATENRPVQERLEMALRAAAHHSAGVEAPFYYL